MFETAMIGVGKSRGALSFSSSLLLQSGVVSGLLVAGMLMPIAQPELPDLRISPPAPKFREAMKIVSTSIERSASALVKPRAFVYAPRTNVRPEPADARNAMDAMVSGLTQIGSGSGAFLDGVVGSPELLRVAAPPAVRETPKPAPATRIEVGGNVLASNLLHRVQPVYPELARRARIEGVVQLHGIITRDGRIAQLRVLSGHPMLVKAALDAVRQWVYSPTLLNQQAVEVEAPIEVRFTLSR